MELVSRFRILARRGDGGVSKEIWFCKAFFWWNSVLISMRTRYKVVLNARLVSFLTDDDTTSTGWLHIFKE